MAWPTKAQRAAMEAAMVEKPDLSSTKLDQLLSMMQGVTEQVSGLSDRVGTLEGKQARFVPAKPFRQPRQRSYEPPEALRAKAMRGLNQAGALGSGGIGLLDDPKELEKLPPDYRPVFQAGDLVRLNPQGFMHGGEDRDGNPRTYEKFMEHAEAEKRLSVDVSDLLGEIKSVIKLGRSFEPKYRVVFPGLTQDASRGDGFWESELLPGE